MDVLTVFFQDVAQQPVVIGKRDYLPLVRQIHRGVVLHELSDGTAAQTYQRVLYRLIEVSSTLRHAGALEKQLDVHTLGVEFETFLDAPDVDVPPSLAALLQTCRPQTDGTERSIEDLAWEYFYLLSLLPPQQRLSFPSEDYNESVSDHFARIAREAHRARQQLVSGTLRYAIGAARFWVGRGVSYLDLVQEGFWGLVRATRSYDERRGHFQQYALRWIRQRIMRSLMETGSLVRVPIHLHEKLTPIGETWRALESQLGRPPNEAELFEALGWFFSQGEPSDEQSHVSPDVPLTIYHDPARLSKARRQVEHYRLISAPPYPLDFPVGEITEDETLERRETVTLSETLVSPTDVEQIVDQRILWHTLRDTLATVLKPRVVEILSMRYGLDDGEEHTLAEVGQHFGVTRERIRQIESQALNRLFGCRIQPCVELQEFLRADHRPQVNSIADQQYMRVRTILADDEMMHPVEDEEAVSKEIRRITTLMDAFVERGRRRTRRKRSYRRTVLHEALEMLGKPAHYTDIHARVIERLPKSLQFSKEQAYRTLFYSRDFRSYGRGVFGLASWKEQEKEENGEVVFRRCPTPLLPRNAHSNAFFDSVMVGRDLLSEKPLQVQAFWLEMQTWARREVTSVQDAQDAFDAWYAVGLIEHVDFVWQKDALLKLRIPEDAAISDMRMYCLNNLCRRVLKMPELLWALAHWAAPDLLMLKKGLFGSEGAGFDVPTRLALLASFGAVQPVGEGWRLTEIGLAVQQAHPAEALPDFRTSDDDVDSGLARAWNEDEAADLGLLDL